MATTVLDPSFACFLVFLVFLVFFPFSFFHLCYFYITYIFTISFSPLRPASMTLDRQRPEILTPPEHPPACCQQQTITVPPDVAAKTRQKHDYPSKAHRRSYARRTGAERTFATAKDPASNNIARGWTRLMGLAPLMLWLACLLAVRNQRILTAWDARQADDARRAAAGLRPRPAAGAARPASASPPPQRRHNQGRSTATISGIAGQTTQTTARRAQHPALTNRISQTASTAPSLEPPQARDGRPHAENVRPKREDKCRSNVKTLLEPPIGIEPMTYALRGVRAAAAHALAAPIARAIAQMALAALGLSGNPVHEPVHARDPASPASCCCA